MRTELQGSKAAEEGLKRQMAKLQVEMLSGNEGAAEEVSRLQKQLQSLTTQLDMARQNGDIMREALQACYLQARVVLKPIEAAIYTLHSWACACLSHASWAVGTMSICLTISASHSVWLVPNRNRQAADALGYKSHTVPLNLIF